MDYETESGLLVSLCIAIHIGNINKAIPRLTAQAKHPEVKQVLAHLAGLPMHKRQTAAALALQPLQQQLLG